jgi:hypothetical protein
MPKLDSAALFFREYLVKQQEAQAGMKTDRIRTDTADTYTDIFSFSV